jgi:hypothetical protein
LQPVAIDLLTCGGGGDLVVALAGVLWGQDWVVLSVVSTSDAPYGAEYQKEKLLLCWKSVCFFSGYWA